DGLVHIELEVALTPRKTDDCVISKDLSAHHRERLALGRVHLSGHNGAPRFVFRNSNLSNPATRTRGEPAHVIRYLHEGDREALHGSTHAHQSIMACKGREFVSRADERDSGEPRNLLSYHTPKLGMCIEAGSDRSSTQCQLSKAGECGLNRLERLV